MTHILSLHGLLRTLMVHPLNRLKKMPKRLGTFSMSLVHDSNGFSRLSVFDDTCVPHSRDNDQSIEYISHTNIVDDRPNIIFQSTTM